MGTVPLSGRSGYNVFMNSYFSLRWMDGALRLLDQRLLPHETRYMDYVDYREVAAAIREMVVRGAPAIGAAAAYGLALAAQESGADKAEALLKDLEKAGAFLKNARPTAVNLAWAVERVLYHAHSQVITNVIGLRRAVFDEAQAIAEEDVQACRQMGLNGAALIPEGAGIVHHCNTGALATVGIGTALGVIRTAYEAGKKIHVYVDETRPRLQGARLTTWELGQLGIPHTVITDGASGFFMRQGKVQLCLVGCDRVAANGDTANKVGTYNLALAAYAHGIPFYVVGPTSTLDLSTVSGEDITIEFRAEEEVTYLGGQRLTPEGTQAANPAFDITPAKYITAIVTERGVAYPPYGKSLVNLAG
jgi:methylthioribose-1-phosphate isomerase